MSEEIKDITQIYSRESFLIQIKKATDVYRDRLVGAPFKGFKDKLFGGYVLSKWAVTEDWKAALRAISDQATIFGYDPECLGLRAKALRPTDDDPAEE
jgi:hypothetical protein